jgi:hypothetical protein
MSYGGSSAQENDKNGMHFMNNYEINVFFF